MNKRNDKGKTRGRQGRDKRKRHNKMLFIVQEERDIYISVQGGGAVWGVVMKA